MEGAQKLHPPLKWSQRKDHVVINVEMRDIKDEEIDFSDGANLKITCTARDKHYHEEFELFAPIDVEASTTHKSGFHLEIRLTKTKPEAWSRLHKSRAKFPNISVDWNNWVDLDSEEEEAEDDDEEYNFDPQAAAGGQEFGQGEPDSDDEEEDDGLGDLEGDVDVETTLKKE